MFPWSDRIQGHRCLRAAWLAAMAIALAGAGCRQAANLTEVQRVSAGPVSVVLLSRDGSLHQKDTFTIEVRSASGGNLVDVGTVRASANMPMPGMAPMFGNIEVRPTGTAGRYAAQANLDMAGGWKIRLDWDGPAGRGTADLTGTVQ